MRAKGLLLIVVLGGAAGTGVAMQQRAGSSNTTADPGYSDATMGPRHDNLDDSPFRSKLEHQRVKTLNEERQKALTREATELLHLAGELQLKAQRSSAVVSNEEMLREVETIERLAHNVKERMKGSR